MSSPQIVLVTGAATGIGRAATLAFAARGATLIAADTDTAGLAETVRLGADAGCNVYATTVDVTKIQQVTDLIETVVRDHGRLDVAINAAGSGGQVAETATVELEDWERMLTVGVTGLFYCLRQQIRQMLTQPTGGTIVNVASVAGLRALPGGLPFAAANHAVVGMTRTAAVEYAGRGIRINALCPPCTVPQMSDPTAPTTDDAGRAEHLRSRIPMRCFTDLEDQVSALLWLASAEASFVTGTALAVDGGLTA